jgi:xylan 1,4-beta-xylosidase
MRQLGSLLIVLVMTTSAAAQSTGIRTYANPLDIAYKYNFEQMNEGISYRSGADPVILNHKGVYYLFLTIAGGYWRSEDLVTWHFVEPSRWPFEDMVAPAARSVGDTIYLYQSNTGQRPILATTEPETGRLEFFNRWMPRLPGMQRPGQEPPGPEGSVPPGPWDPDLFYDEDTGRWFMYWGSSNVYPLYGIELDPENSLTYIGEPVPLFNLDPERHGWERFGEDHRDTHTRPFIEGAWMTKHEGRYYLQYGAPGTEFNVYANGTYLSDDPLGPFEYAPYNPVSYKPGGFMAGAGHGNTFQDAYGNFWNTGTPWVAVNWKFERRIAMFPAGFDADGHMFASNRFGDFPHYAPTGKWSDPSELFTGWMLLSYRRPVTASSERSGFSASNVTDENPRSFWVAESNTPDQWLEIDLQSEYDVRAIQVNFADYESGIYDDGPDVYTQFVVRASTDGRAWTLIGDLSSETQDRPNAYIEMLEPVRARYIRYEHRYIGAAHLAISDMRVFGNGDGGDPVTPSGLAVRRDEDPRNAFVNWDAVPGAVGYNVLWGLAPEKLYQTYQVFADQATELEIRALTVGQGYFFAVESFDVNGVSEISDVVHVP